jgi:hypothetical protein
VRLRRSKESFWIGFKGFKKSFAVFDEVLASFIVGDVFWCVVGFATTKS